MSRDLVIGEGLGWIAINKPHGMSVHNDSGSGGIDALAVVQSLVKSKDPVSPVHRLDRETSGVLLFATTRESASRLQTAIALDGASRKFYRAVLRGKMSGEGFWDFPISDKAEGRDLPQGKASDRKESMTRYQITRSSDFLSEARIEILTGRQHQIRKHARLAKHGIVGDTRYGEMSHARKIASLYGISRMLLHAERLELGEIVLEAPLPPEFDRIFELPSNSNTGNDSKQ